MIDATSNSIEDCEVVAAGDFEAHAFFECSDISEEICDSKCVEEILVSKSPTLIPLSLLLHMKGTSREQDFETYVAILNLNKLRKQVRPIRNVFEGKWSQNVQLQMHIVNEKIVGNISIRYI